MNSEYNPPIDKRSTKDLLAIVENVGDWKDDALEQARKEMELIGYTVSQQKRREQSKIASRKRVNKIKAEARFTPTIMVLLFLFAPLLLAASFGSFPFFDGGKTTWMLKNDGFERKWKQRLLMTTLGNLFWVIIFSISVF